jgi:tRNA-2-methylthio-N6-dimethylallyladenosine synthase
MPRYKILTWGCQMNEEDSEQMSLYLQEQGYEPAERVEDADVVLLNTCSVRRKPEDKVFSTLGHLRTLKQRKPQMVIGVCGCMAQLRADEIRQKAPVRGHDCRHSACGASRRAAGRGAPETAAGDAPRLA